MQSLGGNRNNHRMGLTLKNETDKTWSPTNFQEKCTKTSNMDKKYTKISKSTKIQLQV